MLAHLHHSKNESPVLARVPTCATKVEQSLSAEVFYKFRIYKIQVTAKNKKIEVQGIDIVLYENNKEDYISLTDIARHKNSENH